MLEQIKTEMAMPGAGLDAHKMPGHWLLARMGKRVLRPGGEELTLRMLDALAIGPADAVVEFAPGMGATARRTLARNPHSYTAVERDQVAAEGVRRLLVGPRRSVRIGSAEQTGLPDGEASAVYCEAMLTMQTPSAKAAIVREASRLLRPGGRYAIHEMCLVPDGLPEGQRQEIQRALSEAIHVGARPITSAEWRALLEENGFTPEQEFTAPMHLLEPGRILRDEGLGRTLLFAFNALRDPVARQRIAAMRQVFRRYGSHLGAVVMVARRSN